MSPLLDALTRGIAVGALLVTGLAVWNSAVSRHARIATGMAMLSLAAWVICEGPLWAALGRPYAVQVLSFPVGGFFWLFVAAVFEDRQLLGKLEGFTADGGWKTEGLTIGAVAQALETPEHRLRRLINQKLGHRNFVDFVNGHRIEAAKRRLPDPGQARTTVAAIAFDLGYGSLGPFNRAFRGATGETPTEWRRRALQASPDLQEAV